MPFTVKFLYRTIDRTEVTFPIIVDLNPVYWYKTKYRLTFTETSLNSS